MSLFRHEARAALHLRIHLCNLLKPFRLCASSAESRIDTVIETGLAKACGRSSREPRLVDGNIIAFDRMREARIRRMADRCGYQLVKSDVRDPNAPAEFYDLVGHHNEREHPRPLKAWRFVTLNEAETLLAEIRR